MKRTGLKATLLVAVLAAGSPAASAAADTTDLGQPADVELVEIEVEQHWTVGDLRPSTDVIAFRPAGTLWEATATVKLDQGGVPVISNFVARSDTNNYPVLWTVASPLGVAPNALPAGGEATGKLYFDVTGAAPTSVAYIVDGEDAAVWGR